MIHVDHLSFAYPGVDNTPGVSVFQDLELSVEEGSFVAILGGNGCGKSTLAKHFNSILLPSGGKVYVAGMDTLDENLLLDIRRRVGMVFQNPDNQIVASVVEEDVAFAPENLGVPSEEIRHRVDSALERVGMSSYARHAPHLLSGGQKQRIAIAGVIAMEPKCIVLDEPTAMLDPNSRRDVMELVRHLNKEKGIAVILITHHTDEVVDADSIILMEKGKIVKQGTPKEIFSDLDLLQRVKMDTPQVTALADRLAQNGLAIQTPVLHNEELIAQLEAVLPKDAAVAQAETIPAAKETAVPIMEVKNVGFTYGKKTANECKVLEDISFNIHPGECIGLIGASGSGKTTLIKQLNGLLKADAGDILFDGKSIYTRKYNLTGLRKEVGLVFQYPEHQLFGQTVLADACFGPKNLGMSKEEAEASAKKMLELVGIGEEYYYVSPLEMSGGQKRRVAIAGVLAMNPRILILDEPAAGLDPETKHMVFDLLTKIKRELGLAIVLVSHHMEDVAEYADKVLVLNKGRLEMTGTPEEVFRQADRLTEIGIGIPQITAFTKTLMDRGFPLPHAAVTVEQAEQMILNLAKVGGTADVS
jgi:energy-coupling factor transport system ATP-binding protein